MSVLGHTMILILKDAVWMSVCALKGIRILAVYACIYGYNGRDLDLIERGTLHIASPI